MYDLYGVIVHQGSSRSFGHYYSYCRGFESADTWYKCNDSSTSKIGGVNNALGKQAYILFYQKRIPLQPKKIIANPEIASSKVNQNVKVPVSPVDSNTASTASGTDDNLPTQKVKS